MAQHLSYAASEGVVARKRNPLMRAPAPPLATVAVPAPAAAPIIVLKQPKAPPPRSGKAAAVLANPLSSINAASANASASSVMPSQSPLPQPMLSPGATTPGLQAVHGFLPPRPPTARRPTLSIAAVEEAAAASAASSAAASPLPAGDAAALPGASTDTAFTTCDSVRLSAKRPTLASPGPAAVSRQASRRHLRPRLAQLTTSPRSRAAGSGSSSRRGFFVSSTACAAMRSPTHSSLPSLHSPKAQKAALELAGKVHRSISPSASRRRLGPRTTSSRSLGGHGNGSASGGGDRDGWTRAADTGSVPSASGSPTGKQAHSGSKVAAERAPTSPLPSKEAASATSSSVAVADKGSSERAAGLKSALQSVRTLPVALASLSSARSLLSSRSLVSSRNLLSEKTAADGGKPEADAAPSAAAQPVQPEPAPAHPPEPAAVPAGAAAAEEPADGSSALASVSFPLDPTLAAYLGVDAVSGELLNPAAYAAYCAFAFHGYDYGDAYAFYSAHFAASPEACADLAAAVRTGGLGVGASYLGGGSATGGAGDAGAAAAARRSTPWGKRGGLAVPGAATAAPPSKLVVGEGRIKSEVVVKERVTLRHVARIKGDSSFKGSTVCGFEGIKEKKAVELDSRKGEALFDTSKDSSHPKVATIWMNASSRALVAKAEK